MKNKIKTQESETASLRDQLHRYQQLSQQQQHTINGLQLDIAKTILSEPQIDVDIDDANDSDYVYPDSNDDIKMLSSIDHIESVDPSPSIYSSKAYENYTKLKLLMHGNIKNARFKAIHDIYHDYACKKYNKSSTKLFSSVSRQAINELVKYKLLDLCMIELAYLVHNFFGPRSVFDIYHDEGTDCAIPFLFTSLGFKMDFIDDDAIFIPPFKDGYVIKLLSCSELSDKTAVSSVQQGILPSIYYLNYIGYRLYEEAWTDVVELMRHQTNAMSDENTTAIATSRLLFKELQVLYFGIWICVLHQLSNSIKPALKWLKAARTAPWNVINGEPLINRSKNIDIVELADKASAYFRFNSNNERAKPHVVQAMLESENAGIKLKAFKRNIGERTVNKLINSDRLLARRDGMKKLSVLETKSGDQLISDCRLFYEYSHITAWLRETMATIAFNRTFATPLLVSSNTTFGRMKAALIRLNSIHHRLKQILSENKVRRKGLLKIFVGFAGIDPIAPYNESSKYLSIGDKAIINKMAQHLDFDDASDDIPWDKWANNGGIMTEFKRGHSITHSFQQDVFHRKLWTMSKSNVNACLYMLWNCLDQTQIDLGKRLRNQGQGTKTDCNEWILCTNDSSERAVGMKKFIKNEKPNISKESNESESIGRVNNPFDTMDGIANQDIDEFGRMLGVWNGLATRREKKKEQKERQQNIEQKRKEKAMDAIKNSRKRKIVLNKKCVKKKETRPIVQELDDIASDIWKYYIKKRNLIENKYKHQGRMEWKKQLKLTLIELNEYYCKNSEFKMNKTMKNWGVDKLQKNLYGFCCKYTIQNN